MKFSYIHSPFFVRFLLFSFWIDLCERPILLPISTVDTPSCCHANAIAFSSINRYFLTLPWCRGCSRKGVTRGEKSCFYPGSDPTEMKIPFTHMNIVLGNPKIATPTFKTVPVIKICLLQHIA